MHELDDTRPLTLADVVPPGTGRPEEAIAGRGFTLYESALLGRVLDDEPIEVERPRRHRPMPEPMRHEPSTRSRRRRLFRRYLRAR